jgi:pilus assembly protein Flp/PilA
VDILHWEADSSEEVIMLKFFRSERGQGLAEYALILALIAIAAVVALTFLGGVIGHILSQIGSSM